MKDQIYWTQDMFHLTQDQFYLTQDQFYLTQDLFYLTQDLFYLTQDLCDMITDLNCLIYQEYTSWLLRPDYKHLYPQHPPRPPLQPWTDESNIWVGDRYCSKPAPEYQTHVQQCLYKPKIKLIKEIGLEIVAWLYLRGISKRNRINPYIDMYKMEINAWSREWRSMLDLEINKVLTSV